MNNNDELCSSVANSWCRCQSLTILSLFHVSFVRTPKTRNDFPTTTRCDDDTNSLRLRANLSWKLNNLKRLHHWVLKSVAVTFCFSPFLRGTSEHGREKKHVRIEQNNLSLFQISSENFEEAGGRGGGTNKESLVLWQMKRVLIFHVAFIIGTLRREWAVVFLTGKYVTQTNYNEKKKRIAAEIS